MSLAVDLDKEIKSHNDSVFIEAEGRPSRLKAFYKDYNSSRHHSPISDSTDGIIVLDEDANKWGLELRLYLHFAPACIESTRNTVYRSDYSYRVNDVDVIADLFNLGYQIGSN